MESSATRWPTVLLRSAAAAILLVSCWTGPACGLVDTGAAAPVEFAIYKPDTDTVIGRAKYSVSTEGAYELVTGEYQYWNGDYDIEHDRLAVAPSIRMPALVTFEHTFYQADGSPERSTSADLQSGMASCTSYEKGRKETTTKTLRFPPDTYAGATVIVALQHYLQMDGQGVIEFHAFNCVPEPKVLAVRAYPRATKPWRYDTGEVMQVDVKPDFGWLTFVVAPFVPDIHAWFDPARDWEFEGAQFTRYYKGLELVLVRTSAGQAKPPELSAVKPPTLSEIKPPQLSNAQPTPSP